MNGYTVLRFWNNEVTEDVRGVLQRIAEHLFKVPHRAFRATLSQRIEGTRRGLAQFALRVTLSSSLADLSCTKLRMRE
jgi:hypothetical protein